MGSLRRLTAKVGASLRRPVDPSTGTGTGGETGRGGGPPGQARPDGDHAATGGIAVSYAPELDGDADPGEVVWTWVAYEDDPARGKDRPVLVLGRDGGQLVCVQLSSRDHSDRRDAGDWVPVGIGGWDRETRPSYADVTRLLRVDPGAVRREGSALEERRFGEVLTEVARVHSWGR